MAILHIIYALNKNKSKQRKMKKPLWEPKNPEKSQMYDFIQLVNSQHDLNIKDYDGLHKWSVDYISDFWKAIWDYGEIIYSHEYTSIVKDLNRMPGAKWFINSKLNFAENLLRFQDDKIAIYYVNEGEKI